MAGIDTTDVGLPENTISFSNNRVKCKWITNDTLVVSAADTTCEYETEIRTHFKLKDNIQVAVRYVN